MTEEVIEKTVEELQMEQINEMKVKLDAMIDPEEHAKLKTEYDKLLKDYVNKRPAPKKEEPTVRPVKEIALELQSIGDNTVTNREYIAKSLEYRQAHINEFGTDPWTDFTQTGPDQETATTKKVADTLQRLVDENPTASGFRIALESTMKDNRQLLSKLAKARQK